jgi:ATP-dependent DNA ligase
MNDYEAWLDGRKFLHRAGILYTIRDHESDPDYDPDEEWTFAAWCGQKALPWHQAAFKAALGGAAAAPKLKAPKISTDTDDCDLTAMSTSTTKTIPEFPTLYGESSHGKRKVWRVRVEARSVKVGCLDTQVGVIITEHGYEDGKMVLGERVVEKGKNMGRANATTPVEQAVSEARSVWNKKRDAGYREEGAAAAEDDAEDADASDVPNTSVPLPMLAQDFNKRGASIKFPCYVQHKLDGVRCVAMRDGCGLFSRNGKAFPHLQHIRRALAALPAGTVLDGELYSDTLTFQEIVGLVKRETLRGDDERRLEQIYLCVYDLVVDGMTNKERNVRLQGLLGTCAGAIRLLETRVCERREDVGEHHAASVAAGYEGLMLRNMEGRYRVGVRSTDLQKYKEFQDAEYVVSGYKEGDGVEKGCVIWMCKTPKGQEFAVRPRGTHEERAELMKKAGLHVGKHLTVRFQELTTDGIPRFPVGIAFRDYE